MMDSHSANEPEEPNEPLEKSLPGPPDKLTLAWLFRHMPLAWWFTLGAAFVAAFSLGVTFGNTTFVKELLGKQNSTAPITRTADLPMLDPLHHRLLYLISYFQEQRGLDRIFIDCSGHTPRLPKDQWINFRAELYGTDKTTNDQNNQFSRILDEIPEGYLKRYNTYGFMGYMVSVTKEGQQYLARYK